MASQTGKMRTQATCTVDVFPEIVDAGADITLQAQVSCSPVCDLQGHILLVKDQAGAEAARVEITEFDGAANRTREFRVKAPVRPGEYHWLAVLPAVMKEGVSCAETSTPVSFTVKPHDIYLVVWDTPSAVVAGERFRMKVGMKCSDQCDLTNRDFEIYDHEGTPVATSTLSGDRWPGTTGLYFREVELEAPGREGLYTWSVKTTGSDEGIPHAAGSTSFGIRVVSNPECLVTVEAVDKDSQTPMSGARVVMHPYHALTNEHGVAQLRVAKGEYKLFVSQTRYLTLGMPVEMTADMTLRAELELEPVQERN